MADANDQNLSRSINAPEWAKGASLRDLVGRSDRANTILLNIAKNIGKDSKDYADLLVAIGDLKNPINANTAAQRATAKTESDLDDATIDLKRVLGQTASSITRLAGSDSASLFSGLGSELHNMAYTVGRSNAGLGKMLGTVGLATEIFGMIWQRGSALSHALQDMYDNGLTFSGGMTEITDAVKDTGLNMEQLTKTLTRHGQVVTTMGIKRTMQLSKEFAKLTNNGVNLGMSMEQSNDLMLSYADQQRQLGRLDKLSTEQLAKETRDYGEQLNGLSQATGKSRAEIEAQIKKQKSQPNVAAFLRKLGPAQQAAMSQFNLAGDSAGDFQKAMAILNGPGGIGALASAMPEFFQTFNRLPGGFDKLNQFAAQIKAGDAQGVAKGLSDLIPDLEKTGDQLVELGGTKNQEIGAKLLEFRDNILAASNAAKKLTEPLSAEAQAALEANNQITKARNSLNANLDLISGKITVLAAGPITWLIEGFTTLDHWVRSVIGLGSDQTDHKTSGETSPGHGMAYKASGGIVAALLSTVVITKVVGMVIKTLRSSAGLLKGLMNVGGLMKLPAVPGLNKLENLAGGGKGGGIAGSLTNMGSSISSAISTFGNMVKGAVDGALDTIGKASGTLSKVIVDLSTAIGSGVGKLFEGLLKGLAGGLAAFGNPQILAGAAILSATILLIGAAVAGATWLMGAALPKFAEGMKSFETLDGDKLNKAGEGMIKIGLGLVALGVGEVASAWGAVASGIASLFAVDPITKLKSFGEVSEPLGQAGIAMERFSKTYPASMTAINNAKFDDKAMTSLDKLKTLFEKEGVLTRVGNWLGGNDDFVTKLVKLGDSTANIPLFGARLADFADDYDKLHKTMATPIPEDSIKALGKFQDLLPSLRELNKISQGFDNLPKLIPSLNGFADAYAKLVVAFSQPLSAESLKQLRELVSIKDLVKFIDMLPSLSTGLNKVSQGFDNLPKLIPNLNGFADAYTHLVDAFSQPLSAESLKQMRELVSIKALDKFIDMLPSLSRELNKISQGFDNLPKLIPNLHGFADAYTHLVDAFSQPLSAESLKQLRELTGIVEQQASNSSPGFFSSLFGSSTPAPAAPTTSATAPASDRAAYTTPEQKHKQMMDAFKKLNDNIELLLQEERRSTRVIDNGLRSAAGVVN